MREKTVSKTRQRLYCSLWVVAIAVTIILSAANLFLGELNQDEGWYLYAGRLVSQGKLPYVDFASTQGPVMPFVYACAQPLVALWGVAGGRLFTVLLGLASLLGAAWVAARIVRPDRKHVAALTAFIIAGVNVYQSYFCTIVKTYSLAGLFLTLGFLFLTFARGRRRATWAFLSGVFLTLAGATRTSAGLAVPIVFAVLLRAAFKQAKGEGTSVNTPTHQHSTTHAILFMLGALLTGLAVFGPFLLKSPDGLWFALFEYHAGRQAGGGMQWLAYKAGFISRVVQAYFVAVGLAVVVCIRRLMEGTVGSRGSAFATGFGGTQRSPSNSSDTHTHLPAALWLSILGITLLHFLAPFPYDDYQVMVFPLLAAVLAVELSGFRNTENPTTNNQQPTPNVQGKEISTIGCWKLDVGRWAFDTSQPLAIPLIVFLLCVLSSLSSPINQGWFVGEQDRMWWPLKEESSLCVLRRSAALVRAVTEPGDVLLTQDTYLAVEAGMNVPEGLELGPFSYFPDWSSERAAGIHVVNREMLLELLGSCEAPVAAFSGYGLAISSPAIAELPVEEQDVLWDKLKEQYVPFREIEKFGQDNTTLQILLRTEK